VSLINEKPDFIWHRDALFMFVEKTVNLKLLVVLTHHR
jgi:hypothetical protein